MIEWTWEGMDVGSVDGEPVETILFDAEGVSESWAVGLVVGASDDSSIASYEGSNG